MRVLFVSNGHGEDSMAAEIARRLPSHIEAEAYPTLGAGRAYEGICPVVGPRANLATQGERMFRGSHVEDLPTAKPGATWRAIRFMRGARPRYDKIVVLGDMVGIVLCWLAGAPVAIYVDVFKYGKAHRYSPIERWLILRTVQVVFNRDDILAAQLRTAGVEARFAGNIMMDTVQYGDYDPAPMRAHELALAILPGSRAVAPHQFSVQAAAVRLLPPELMPDMFVALAPGIEPEMLAAAAGLHWKPPTSENEADLGRLIGHGLEFHLARGSVGSILETADVVLSLAGTATWQAVGMGKPVVSTVSPNARRKRLRDEAALTGPARQVCGADPEEVARAVSALLSDPADRARRGAIGRQRMGPPGAIDAIIAELG